MVREGEGEEGSPSEDEDGAPSVTKPQARKKRGMGISIVVGVFTWVCRYERADLITNHMVRIVV